MDAAWFSETVVSPQNSTRLQELDDLDVKLAIW